MCHPFASFRCLLAIGLFLTRVSRNLAWTNVAPCMCARTSLFRTVPRPSSGGLGRVWWIPYVDTWKERRGCFVDPHGLHLLLPFGPSDRSSLSTPGIERDSIGVPPPLVWEHPCATFWADESLVLVFHHVVRSKRTGHESSLFWTLFHVVGVLCPFLPCLLPVCATLRGVTFGNQAVLGCLRVKMGIRAVRLRGPFGLWFFYVRFVRLSLFLMRSCM